MIERVGSSVHGGHYICHVVTSEGRTLTYDDASPVADSQAIPESAMRNAVQVLLEEDTNFSYASLAAFRKQSPSATPTAPLADTEPDVVAPTAPDLAAPPVSLAGSTPVAAETSSLTQHASSCVNGDALAQCVVQDQGQDRLRKDAQELLSVFAAEHCGPKEARRLSYRFLQTLPMYVSESGTTLTLQNAVDLLDVFISGLKHNAVNSTAALHIKLYHGDCLPYPFMVLVEATSLATALPTVFHEK